MELLSEDASSDSEHLRPCPLLPRQLVDDAVMVPAVVAAVNVLIEQCRPSLATKTAPFEALAHNDELPDVAIRRILL